MSIRYATSTDPSLLYFAIDPNELKTVENYEDAHRLYWSFIAEAEIKYKPVIRNIDTRDSIPIWSYCFACHFAHSIDLSENHCKSCPIKKYRDMARSGQESACVCRDEPYRTFCHCGGPRSAALQISQFKFTDPREDQAL